MSFGYTLYLPALFGSPAPIGPAPGSTHTIQCHAPDLFANSSAQVQFLQAEPHAGPSSFHGVGMAAQPSWLPNPKFGSESSTPFSQQVAIDNDSTSGEEATSSSRSAYNATLPGLKALEGLPPAPYGCLPSYASEPD